MGSELQQLQECASVGERLSSELSKLQREMVVLGERHQRQQEHLSDLPLLVQHQEETNRVKEACREEIGGNFVILQQHLTLLLYILTCFVPRQTTNVNPFH
jgi:hypothetical protein